MGVTASLGTYDSVVYFLGVGHAYALTWDLFPMGRSWTRARIGRARLVPVSLCLSGFLSKVGTHLIAFSDDGEK